MLPLFADAGPNAPGMWLSISFGVLLVIIAGLLIRKNELDWADAAADDQLTPSLTPMLRSRYRRRLQASVLLLLIGVMIPIGDLPAWKAHPKMFGFYWLFVIVLVAWVVLLALADWLSVYLYSRIATGGLERVQAARAQLLAEAEELRRKHRDADPPN
jgi:hypothetical protein